MDAGQIVRQHRRVRFDPHARSAAARRTCCFQSGISGTNGPASRPAIVRSNSLAAQSDSTNASRYSSFECAPHGIHPFDERDIEGIGHSDGDGGHGTVTYHARMEGKS